MTGSHTQTAPCVLVVDDDAPVRAIAALLLKAAGFRCVQAGSAVEALTLAERLPFDLLLTDVQMPGMNGIELAEAMWVRSPDLPIVLMSGFAPEGVISASSLPLVSKPFAPNALTTAVRTALASPRRAQTRYMVA